MQLGSPIAPLEILRHRSKSNPPHPSQTQRRMGHPQELRLNFEVIYPSGIILTEAPSIVETTRAQQNKVGHPPQGLTITAASRTPLWLASGWGFRDRHLSTA